LYAKVMKGQSFFGRGCKIVLSTERQIHLEDVSKVMKAILG